MSKLGIKHFSLHGDDGCGWTLMVYRHTHCFGIQCMDPEADSVTVCWQKEKTYRSLVEAVEVMEQLRKEDNGIHT